jgi:hypothetical protein
VLVDAITGLEVDAIAGLKAAAVALLFSLTWVSELEQWALV